MFADVVWNFFPNRLTFCHHALFQESYSGALFCWVKSQHESFQASKNLLSSLNLLINLFCTVPLLLRCNVSAHGVHLMLAKTSRMLRKAVCIWTSIAFTGWGEFCTHKQRKTGVCLESKGLISMSYRELLWTYYRSSATAVQLSLHLPIHSSSFCEYPSHSNVVITIQVQVQIQEDGSSCKCRYIEPCNYRFQ